MGNAMGNKISDKKIRYEFIDILRGITILSMILYHLFWDLVYIYNINIPWYKDTPGFVWQQSICIVFILLSGFCFSLSKSPLKRGIVVLFSGVLVTLATFVFAYDERIVFGILTLLGFCMIVMKPISKVLCKVNSILGFVLSLAMFLATYNINNGYLFGSFFSLKLPKTLYSGYAMTFLGFMDKDFVSSDYFSVFPWIFVFICGYFLFRIWKENKSTLFENIKSVPIISFLGRHSLIIYLVHQAIIYGVLYILFNYIL